MRHLIYHSFFGVGLLILATGCGRQSAPPPVDAKDARAGLTTALEAWKRGDTKESLSRSMQFDEPMWDKGFSLLSYKIAPNDEYDGRMVRLTVQLSLKDKSGAESEKQIAYTVDTAGRVVIVHSDWDEEDTKQ